MISADQHAWIGLDLGTSALKAVALGRGGRVLARAAAAYPTARPSARGAEQLPAQWLTAIDQACAELASQVPAERWQAIGLSAMMPVLVPGGAAGEPVGPAVTWEDSRAEDQAGRLRARCGAAGLYQETGQWIDGRYLLPMFARLAHDEPAVAATVTTLLSAKDYLFGWLTGAPATDPSTAAGFGCYRLADGQWDHGILSAAVMAGPPADAQSRSGLTGPFAAAGPAPGLPPVLPSAAMRPLLPARATRFGCGQIPVCVGAADSVAGALGLGVRRPGQIAYVAGTSTVILGVTDRLVLDPAHRFLVTPLADPGHWGLEMDLLATGSALRWLAELLGGGLDARGIADLAAGTDPLNAPVVLPYLSPGEQGALWDRDLHGAIAGLTLAHGPRHLARGMVNGIVLESRRCLAVLDQAAGFGSDVLVAGGSAAGDAFRADLADATGRRVVMPNSGSADFSALGAAMLALRAAEGSDDACPPGNAALIAEPDDSRRKTWDQLWDRHEQARLSIARQPSAAGPASER